jgi:ABC-type transport system substrate-binding protein
VAIALVVVLLASACGGGSGSGGADDGAVSDTTAEDPVSGGRLVYGLTGESDGFNPASSRWTYNGLTVAKALYDPIATIGPDGTAQPYLVEAIEPNEDFTQWTITMRDGVEFHNGDPLTPEVLATHLKSMQLAPLTFFVFEPVDAVGVVDETARPQHEAGEISDEEYDVLRRQVVVFMSEPWAAFPAMLAGFQLGYVAHPDFVSGEIDEPVGTGPFVWDEWVPDDHLTLTRNDSYWREGLPYLDAVEFRPIVDPTTRFNSLRSGDLDMTVTNAPGQVVDLANDDDAHDELQFHPSESASDEMCVLLNTQSGPTADVEVRRALQLATDRQAIVDALYDGYYETADGPFESESPWYSDPGWPDPDPEAARELVEEWEAENGPLSIALTTTTAQDDLELGQVLVEQWSAAGVDVELRSLDQATVAAALPVGDFEAYLLQFFNGSDPDEHYAFWDPDPENIGGPGELSINFARYTSETVQDALHGARGTDDPDERAALYSEVWSDWAENVPYLWLFHTEFQLIASQQLRGLESFTFPDGDPAASMVWGASFLTTAWFAE